MSEEQVDLALTYNCNPNTNKRWKSENTSTTIIFEKTGHLKHKSRVKNRCEMLCYGIQYT